MNKPSMNNYDQDGELIPTRTPKAMTNLPKVSALTPDQVRVMVATEVGWNFVVHPITGQMGFYEKGMIGESGYQRTPWDVLSPEIGKQYLPDYPNDLNAMASVEDSMFEDEHYIFRRELQKLAMENSKGHSGKSLVINDRYYVSAPAIRRAQAFLIAKGRARL